MVGSVKGLAGHLGCIADCREDGRGYGALEYKHDVIGNGILNKLERSIEVRDGFYMAIFDVEKIDRMDMDAERDGIMTAVDLKGVGMEDSISMWLMASMRTENAPTMMIRSSYVMIYLSGAGMRSL